MRKSAIEIPEKLYIRCDALARYRSVPLQQVIEDAIKVELEAAERINGMFYNGQDYWHDGPSGPHKYKG